MKIFQKALFITAVSLFFVLIFARTGFAQSPNITGYVTGSFEGTIRVPSGVGPSISLDQVKTRILAAIDQKIAKLNELPAKIDANANLTADQKEQLKVRVQEAIATLTEIKAKVQSAQSVDDFRKIIQEYLKNIQQSGENRQSLSTVQSFQTVVSELQLQGADTTGSQFALDDLKVTLTDQVTESSQTESALISAPSTEELKKALADWQANQSTETKSALQLQWQKLADQLKQLKLQYPSLFPTRRPTDIAPTLSSVVPSLTRTPLGTSIPSPKVTCKPRPACLDARPACSMPEPLEGWCPAKTTPSGIACADVITPARNSTTGECRDFANSCIPEGWVKVASCGQ